MRRKKFHPGSSPGAPITETKTMKRILRVFGQIVRLLYLTQQSHTIDDSTLRNRARKALRAYGWVFWSLALETRLFLRVGRTLSLFDKFLCAFERTNYYFHASRSPMAGMTHFFLVRERDQQFRLTDSGKKIPEEVIWEHSQNNNMSWKTVFDTREMLWSRDCDILLMRLKDGL